MRLFEGFTDPFSGFLLQRSWSQERDLLINYKILLTKPHSGIAVLMLSYLLPIRWQGHTVVSDHTVSNLSPTTPNHTCSGRIGATLYTATLEWKP